jgi:hypothetical protein
VTAYAKIKILLYAATSEADRRVQRSVIGSEQACGLTYDRDPIERFITEHVKASDMSFPSTLNMMTMGTKVAIKEMSESSLTAHCTQIRRVAKEYGFIGLCLLRG